MAKAFDSTRFVRQFVEEATERIKRVGDGLLSLEAERGSIERLQEILREIHTVKGSANMLGLKNITALAHSIEAALGKEKEEEGALTPPAMNILYQSLDTLSRMVELVRQEGKDTFDPSDICSKLTAIISSEEIRKVEPPIETTPLAECHHPQTPTIETIRITVNKIDSLSKISAELMYWIIRETGRHYQIKDLLSSRFQELSGEKQKNYQKILESYSEGIVLGDRLIRQLQEEILSISLVSLTHVFDVLPMAVRGLSQELGKEIELVIEGGEIAVDQKIINQIGTPLIHLIRNAIDHGIEPPDQRRLCNKAPKGKLRVAASQIGSRVLIEIEDDGRGIDFSTIREEIVKKGLLPGEEAVSLTEGELMGFIFKPGFSTQTIVTEVSGRGIGMDVVKKTIEKLNGTITLTTESGKGTIYTLNFPFYLALIRSLLFIAGESTFAVPLNYIDQAISLNPDMIMTSEKRHIILFQDKIIPAVKLTNLFRMPAMQGNEQKYYALILKQGNQRVGLLIDEILEEKDIIIKPLGKYFNTTGEISGVTVLSSGDVALVLNVAVITEAVIQGLDRKISQDKGKMEEMREGASVLLVEDSLIIQDLEKNILQTAGYKVETANDGLDAIEKLKNQDFDLIITDIEMPRMNGFELITAVRKDDRYKEIPIVVVTTKERREDRLRGLEIGADAYLLKGGFDQGEFLSVIERLARR